MMDLRFVGEHKHLMDERTDLLELCGPQFRVCGLSLGDEESDRPLPIFGEEQRNVPGLEAGEEPGRRHGGQLRWRDASPRRARPLTRSSIAV